jgi:hypothetical protein
MSYHNHDPEERIPPISGGVRDLDYEKKKRERQLVENIEKDIEKAQASRDKEIADDLMMLDRLNEFDLTEKDLRFLRHLVGLPDGRGIPLLINWIQGRTGSCILHYDNKYVQNLPVGKFNERNK